jgi:hypothetical protein
MKLKGVFLFVFAMIAFSYSARADSSPQDNVIAVCGSLVTPQGESFQFSYEADLTSYILVPGTLSFSSSGPAAQFSSLNVTGPEGAAWQDGAGDTIELLLFRTVGCTDVEDPGDCTPDVGPNEIFSPETQANINSFANGILEFFSDNNFNNGQVFRGDVTVSIIRQTVPESSTILMLAAGILLLILLKSVLRRTTRIALTLISSASEPAVSTMPPVTHPLEFRDPICTKLELAVVPERVHATCVQ